MTDFRARFGPYVTVENPSGVEVEVRTERLPALLKEGFVIVAQPAKAKPKPAPAVPVEDPEDDEDDFDGLEGADLDDEDDEDTEPVRLIDFNDVEVFPNKATLVAYGASMTPPVELDPKMTRGEMVEALNTAYTTATAEE